MVREAGAYGGLGGCCFGIAGSRCERWRACRCRRLVDQRGRHGGSTRAAANGARVFCSERARRCVGVVQAFVGVLKVEMHASKSKTGNSGLGSRLVYPVLRLARHDTVQPCERHAASWWGFCGAATTISLIARRRTGRGLPQPCDGHRVVAGQTNQHSRVDVRDRGRCEDDIFWGIAPQVGGHRAQGLAAVDSGPFRVHVQWVSTESSPRARRLVSLSQCPSARLKVLDANAALRPARRRLKRLSPMCVGRLLHSIISPCQHVVERFETPSLDILRPATLAKPTFDWSRQAAGDGFPTRAGVGATHLPALCTVWNPSLRTRRPLFCYGNRIGSMAICRCARSIDPDRRRLPCFCAASYCNRSRIVHHHWTALQSCTNTSFAVL